MATVTCKETQQDKIAITNIKPGMLFRVPQTGSLYFRTHTGAIHFESAQYFDQTLFSGHIYEVLKRGATVTLEQS